MIIGITVVLAVYIGLVFLVLVTIGRENDHLRAENEELRKRLEEVRYEN